MENKEIQKWLKSWKNRRRKIMLGIASSFVISGGIGLGIGYAIWHTKQNNIPPQPPIVSKTLSPNSPDWDTYFAERNGALSGFKKDTTKAFAASAYECIDLSNFSSIKEKAFMENPILTTEARNIKITFENNTSGLSIDMGAFAACAKIETVVLPKSGSLSIGDFAFTQCTGLKNVLFPIDSNVTLSLFGASAFFRCESIEKIDLSSTSFAGTIAKRAFSQCKNLKEILLPGGTFSIGINVFEECTNLETITPSTSKTTIIDSIADGTFEGCPSLTVSGIEKLKNSINKSNLAYVENKSGNNIVGAAIVAAIGKTWIRKAGLISGDMKDSLNDWFTSENSIVDAAFSECTSLKSIDLTNAKATGKICNSTFYKCTSLKEIHIPVGVTSIGSLLFYGCNNLTDVYWNNSSNPTSIGNQAFDECGVGANHTIHYNNNNSTTAWAWNDNQGEHKPIANIPDDWSYVGFKLP